MLLYIIIIIIDVAQQLNENQSFRFREKFSKNFATRRQKTLVSFKVSIHDFSGTA